jgi:hypothetical protein
LLDPAGAQSQDNPAVGNRRAWSRCENGAGIMCGYTMNTHPTRSKLLRRTLLEMSFIIFLFYSNLLMGQYNFGHSFSERPILSALRNIFTIENFMIAIAAAFVGHVAFDHIRKRL